MNPMNSQVVHGRSDAPTLVAHIGRIWRKAMPAIVILGLFLFWEFGERWSGYPPQYVVPLPSSVIINIISDWQFFIKHLSITVLSATIGFLLGLSFALLLAVACILNKDFERIITPLALAVRSVPLVAVTPILIFIFGVGIESKIAVAVLVTFFPTLVNMIVGLRNVDYRMLELFHVMNASRWDVLFRLRFPASVPQFFAALKIAIPSAFLGATVAEWINATAGIGYIIIVATYRFRVVQLYAAMVLAALFVGLAYLSIARLELLLPWRRNAPIT